MSTFNELAIQRLEKEKKEVKGQKESIINTAVFNTLSNFCKQETEFAQAIYQSEKTFQECLSSCVKDVGNGISDIDVYKRAVNFYFPTADVNFKMEIDLIGEAKTGIKNDNNSKSILSLSFDDLFNF